LDIRKDTGFIPTTYKDQETGFEFSLVPAADMLSDYCSHIAPQVGSRDQCASFCWHGDLNACAAAITAAAALTKLTDGISYDPTEDIVCGADEAIEAARRDLLQIDQAAKPDASPPAAPQKKSQKPWWRFW
jgi:hypothetical protein